MAFHYKLLDNSEEAQKGCYLSITWHKVENEIYCHHAYISLPVKWQSLFAPINSEITIETVSKSRNTDNIWTSYFHKVMRILPINKSTVGSYQVNLNSPEILDALTLNEWTLGKNGKKVTLKAYPIRLTAKVDDRNYIFNFDGALWQTPRLICNKEVEQMQLGEKLETIIYL